MSKDNDHACDVLNGLIKTTLDSVGGYKDAADSADSSRFKGMFAERAIKRELLARELQEEVRALGGKPQEHQGLVGKAHNEFVNLKAALTGNDDKAVIDEVERGEDHIKEKFEDALEDDDLPPSVRAKVARACEGIKADHDEVSRIKRTLH
jgi:uncharacterized protein (TIGR02284 family)